MSASPALAAPQPAPWARRCALLAALCAVPLVLFGGSVTTLGAGMAVDGWLVAEGHFLVFFPVDKWFRDTPTFVEHTHRLFGILVGLCALACLALAWLRPAGRAQRASALLALLAVCAQGTLGGLRVLAADSGLAFVHGAAAQLVFAVLCANAVVLSRGWSAAEPPAQRAALHAVASAAVVAFLVLTLQVVLGAWYRHGLRPEPVSGSTARLALHGLGALASMAAVAAVVRRGAALANAGASLPAGLARALRRLPALLLVQIVLGGLAWAGFRPHAIGPAEWGLSIAHVLGGALLFADLAVVVLWTRHLVALGEPRAVVQGALGDAR